MQKRFTRILPAAIAIFLASVTAAAAMSGPPDWPDSDEGTPVSRIAQPAAAPSGRSADALPFALAGGACVVATGIAAWQVGKEKTVKKARKAPEGDSE